MNVRVGWQSVDETGAPLEASAMTNARSQKARN
jgi:hypothetical protein